MVLALISEDFQVISTKTKPARKKPVRKQNILNLKVTRPSQVRYGERSLRVLGPKIWNNPPAHVKSATNLL